MGLKFMMELSFGLMILTTDNNISTLEWVCIYWKLFNTCTIILWINKILKLYRIRYVPKSIEPPYRWRGERKHNFDLVTFFAPTYIHALAFKWHSLSMDATTRATATKACIHRHTPIVSFASQLKF